MAKRIGYIEKDGVIFVSVKDVFEYLREMEVITTDVPCKFGYHIFM